MQFTAPIAKALTFRYNALYFIHRTYAKPHYN